MQTNGPILIALISASAAIAGALLSQVVQLLHSHLDKKHQRHILLRTRYEELADQMTRSAEWLTSLGQTSNTPDTPRSEHPVFSPPRPDHARKSVQLAHLYFPELRTPCENYLNACVAFSMVLIDSMHMNRGRDLMSKAIIADEARFKSALKAFNAARQVVDDAIIKYAKRYTRY